MIYFLLVLFASHLLMFAKSTPESRPFLGVLLFSHAYFCIGGYYFWIEYAGLDFVGMSWDVGSVALSLIILSISTVFVAGIVFLAAPRGFAKPMSNRFLTPPTLNYGFLMLGGTGAAFVALSGFDQNEGQASNSFLLIAYQFADLLIPSIVFLVACRPSLPRYLFVITFVLYAVFVGFRYKLAILFFPLFLLRLYGQGSKVRKGVEIGAATCAVLALFSFMTLFRVKFGTPDLSRTIDQRDLLYSFFAESNITFGLTIITKNYLFGDINYHFLQPVIDGLLELIPRALMPSRETGLYLVEMKNFFNTAEGAASATAYPFIGEFIVMGGHLGLVIGVFVYSIVYLVLHRIILKSAQSKRILLGGIGLLASMMGYYHYSRGYLPQQLKAYIFIIFPYALICSAHARESRAQLMNKPMPGSWKELQTPDTIA